MANNLLNNKDNVSFEFKGFMTNDLVLKYYQNNYLDCFISTSEYEGLPVSMMEAISFGIPVIAPDVGGVSEIVNEKTGILINKQCNISDIKQALLDLHSFSDMKKTELRNGARMYWESGFNADVNYSTFVKEILSQIEKQD
jgi:glycosyltransferase involved in cell wall biosynthesis